MSRPATIDDLPRYAREPRALLGVYDWNRLCQLPQATRLIGELHDAVRGIPGVRITESTITVDPTPDETDRALADAQLVWDRGQEVHTLWENTGSVPPKQDWSCWRAYLTAEQLDLPEVLA